MSRETINTLNLAYNFGLFPRNLIFVIMCFIYCKYLLSISKISFMSLFWYKDSTSHFQLFAI